MLQIPSKEQALGTKLVLGGLNGCNTLLTALNGYNWKIVIEEEELYPPVTSSQNKWVAHIETYIKETLKYTYI